MLIPLNEMRTIDENFLGSLGEFIAGGFLLVIFVLTAIMLRKKKNSPLLYFALIFLFFGIRYLLMAISDLINFMVYFDDWFIYDLLLIPIIAAAWISLEIFVDKSRGEKICTWRVSLITGYAGISLGWHLLTDPLLFGLRVGRPYDYSDYLTIVQYLGGDQTGLPIIKLSNFYTGADFIVFLCLILLYAIPTLRESPNINPDLKKYTIVFCLALFILTFSMSDQLFTNWFGIDIFGAFATYINIVLQFVGFIPMMIVIWKQPEALLILKKSA